MATGIQTQSAVSEKFPLAADYSRHMSEHVHPADRAECISAELINGTS